MNKYELLKRVESYILENHLKPGDRLPGEIELAGHFGVSRGTLREIIAHLTLKGVLERKTSQGTIIRKPGFEDIANDLVFQLKMLDCGKEEMKAARELLELSIIPSLIRYATPMHLDTLAAINENMLNHRKKLAEADKLDLKFHMTLTDITGNRLIKLFAQILTVHFEGEGRPPFRNAAAMENSYESHKAIIRALSERNASELARLVMEHIRPIPV